jgi:hypothetical protein
VRRAARWRRGRWRRRWRRFCRRTSKAEHQREEAWIKERVDKRTAEERVRDEEAHELHERLLHEMPFAAHHERMVKLTNCAPYYVLWLRCGGHWTFATRASRCAVGPKVVQNHWAWALCRQVRPNHVFQA